MPGRSTGAADDGGAAAAPNGTPRGHRRLHGTAGGRGSPTENDTRVRSGELGGHARREDHGPRAPAGLARRRTRAPVVCGQCACDCDPRGRARASTAAVHGGQEQRAADAPGRLAKLRKARAAEATALRSRRQRRRLRLAKCACECDPRRRARARRPCTAGRAPGRARRRGSRGVERHAPQRHCPHEALPAAAGQLHLRIRPTRARSGRERRPCTAARAPGLGRRRSWGGAERHDAYAGQPHRRMRRPDVLSRARRPGRREERVVAAAVGQLHLRLRHPRARSGGRGGPRRGGEEHRTAGRRRGWGGAERHAPRGTARPKVRGHCLPPVGQLHLGMRPRCSRASAAAMTSGRIGGSWVRSGECRPRTVLQSKRARISTHSNTRRSRS
jgi:hypothetical protein